MQKRNRDLNLETDCKITKNCELLCALNGENWFYAASPDELPEMLRFEYINCQHRKRLEAQNETIGDSNFNFEEAEREHLKSKKNPKYILEKIQDKFEDLRTSKDVEPLLFPNELTLEQKQDKIAFEEDVILTETRTRPKVCQDNQILLNYLKTRFEININQLKIAIEAVMNIKDVKFIKLLGSGQDGVAFTICNPSISSQLFVIKYQYDEEYKNTSLFKHEYNMQIKFFRAGIAPEPKFVHLSPNIIVMDKLDGIVNDLLEKRCSQDLLDGILDGVVHLLLIMCANKLSHGDLHWVNIGYVYQLKESLFDTDEHPVKREMIFQLIDFGKSQDHGCEPEIELSQLIRRTFPQICPTLNLDNLLYLRKNLFILYSQNYELDIEEGNNVTFWTKKLGSKLF